MTNGKASPTADRDAYERAKSFFEKVTDVKFEDFVEVWWDDFREQMGYVFGPPDKDVDKDSFLEWLLDEWRKMFRNDSRPS